MSYEISAFSVYRTKIFVRMDTMGGLVRAGLHEVDHKSPLFDFTSEKDTNSQRAISVPTEKIRQKKEETDFRQTVDRDER